MFTPIQRSLFRFIVHATVPAAIFPAAIFPAAIFPTAIFPTAIFLAAIVGVSAPIGADEYSAETFNGAAPEEVGPEIRRLLVQQGIRVLKDGNRTVCEIWPLKEWAIVADVETNDERLYPFEVGQLLGVVRLGRRGSDFRDQDISRGVYTLRYALQPVDGNHVGTSPTRDFLLLVKAEDDQSPQPMDIRPLNAASAAAAGSTHPAMWSLQKLADNAESTSVRKAEANDWWVLRIASEATGADEALPIDVVVVGHAAE